MVHRLSITPMPEFDQSPQAKHQTAGCYSLSPRERVRVRGNDGSTAAGCRLSKGLLRKPLRPVEKIGKVTRFDFSESPSAGKLASDKGPVTASLDSE